MGYERRHRNPGRRERAAGKRHRRAVIQSHVDGAVLGPLKAGSRHMCRHWKRVRFLSAAVARGGMTVAESEKRPNGASETLAVALQPGPTSRAAHPL